MLSRPRGLHSVDPLQSSTSISNKVALRDPRATVWTLGCVMLLRRRSFIAWRRPKGVCPAEHGPIMDVQAMARAASTTADVDGTAEAVDAGAVKSSTATASAPFGDFTPDEEKRFLASADGDKIEAMRRYKACLVRGVRDTVSPSVRSVGSASDARCCSVSPPDALACIDAARSPPLWSLCDNPVFMLLQSAGPLMPGLMSLHPWRRFLTRCARFPRSALPVPRSAKLSRVHGRALPYLVLQDWREKVGVGSILEQPQPFFDFAKGMYTHGLVCFTKNGAPVWLDKVGDMKRDWAGFKVRPCKCSGCLAKISAKPSLLTKVSAAGPATVA